MEKTIQFKINFPRLLDPIKSEIAIDFCRWDKATGTEKRESKRTELNWIKLIYILCEIVRRS